MIITIDVRAGRIYTNDDSKKEKNICDRGERRNPLFSKTEAMSGAI